MRAYDTTISEFGMRSDEAEADPRSLMVSINTDSSTQVASHVTPPFVQIVRPCTWAIGGCNALIPDCTATPTNSTRFFLVLIRVLVLCDLIARLIAWLCREIVAAQTVM
jgi:hypothetical protein